MNKRLEVYNFVRVIDRENGPDKSGFIRLFQDEMSKDLWEAYCEAFNIEEPESVKSIKVDLKSIAYIEAERYQIKDYMEER